MNPHLFESALQSGSFWIRSESGIVWTLNPDIIFFIRWRNKIEPSSLPWILYSRWKPLLFYPSRSQPCSSHFSDFRRAESVIFRALYDACLALLPIFPEESWVLERIRIRVGYVPERGKYGYLWTWKFWNPQLGKVCGLKNIRIRTILQCLRLKALCMYVRRNN